MLFLLDFFSGGLGVGFAVDAAAVLLAVEAVLGAEFEAALKATFFLKIRRKPFWSVWICII